MEDKNEIKLKFNEKKKNYLRLGKNIEEALKSFLDEEKIVYLNIYHRVKKFDSFYEKIFRKNYSNPFEEIEDICGIRIICYYASDISKIQNIIRRELTVLESENKSENLGLKEFAYRSVHNIINIKDDWLSTPNYRGLQNLKAEIQIRTVLMHAWAEIEHKLNYKSDAEVPSHFQRKLFRLSAKFEEADEQFEELRDGITQYRNNIVRKAKEDNKFKIDQEFNIDSFQAFLKFHFPKSEIIFDHFLNSTFDRLAKKNANFAELEEIILKLKPHIKEIAKDLRDAGYINDIYHNPTEIIGFGEHLLGKENYDTTIPSWKNTVNKWKRKIN
ncbi:GTP pyrophosphokinase [Chryseobacterium gwangjuense]|uniref:GTP pyrophosphokinase n=1 Tax=Chryseobacterium gwangjuense TaxID=1069980 RepID=UPI001E540E4A|nr:hypothetical protein [Chryseobacterium gwangjuense]MCE3075990.1 hypothetical protein [Chryseobacterium gwangjuense]